MLLLEKESLAMPLLAEFVFETLPGGGVFSVVRDGVGLGIGLDACRGMRPLFTFVEAKGAGGVE
jgi:hypothetical protein